MQDLVIEMRRLNEQLREANKELRARGVKKSEAEAKYRAALAEKILVERDKGIPVTIISDICRGDRKIAQLKLERDIAEILYDSCLQMIFNTRQSREIVLQLIRQEGVGSYEV